RDRLCPQGPAGVHRRDRRDRLPGPRHRPGHRAARPPEPAPPPGRPRRRADRGTLLKRSRPRQKAEGGEMLGKRRNHGLLEKRRRNHESHESTRIRDGESLSMSPSHPNTYLLAHRMGLHLRGLLSLSVFFVLSVVHSSLFSTSSCYADSVVSRDDLRLLPSTARLV